MKKFCFLFLAVPAFNTTLAQKPGYATCFKETAEATKSSSQLWDKDLYSGILLVDPQTRELFANVPDSAGLLKEKNGIYTGVLPNEVNMANTAMSWAGRRWAMVMLPLPENKNDRINLLVHELFHKAQPGLGFMTRNTESNHLDKKDGRIYLRLELEALKKALKPRIKDERDLHLFRALYFRKYRHILFPGSENIENALELNEGLAEYTGLMSSPRTEEETIAALISSIDNFIKNPTYVRSFAYCTVPVYGYLLSQKQKSWNKSITDTTNLAGFFIKSFGLNVTGNDAKAIATTNTDPYNGTAIASEEEKREEERLKILAAYKTTFIRLPHAELSFEQMNISFDPRNIVPLDDCGTVYPNLRITDNWGILTVEKGALISTLWDKVHISEPLTFDDNKITGDGWALELKPGYSLVKDEKDQHYRLMKR